MRRDRRLRRFLQVLVLLAALVLLALVFNPPAAHAFVNGLLTAVPPA